MMVFSHIKVGLFCVLPMTKGGYYHLPSVPCAYFGVIVSGLCDENMNFT